MLLSAIFICLTNFNLPETINNWLWELLSLLIPTPPEKKWWRRRKNQPYRKLCWHKQNERNDMCVQYTVNTCWIFNFFATNFPLRCPLYSRFAKPKGLTELTAFEWDSLRFRKSHFVHLFSHFVIRETPHFYHFIRSLFICDTTNKCKAYIVWQKA